MGTYTLTPIRHKSDQTDREVFDSTLEAALSSGDVPELKSTQDIDKYADFIVTVISTAVGKAIPASKSGRPESQPVSKEKVGLGSSTLRHMTLKGSRHILINCRRKLRITLG